MRHEMIPFGTNRQMAGTTPFNLLQSRMNRLFDDIWRDMDGGVADELGGVVAPKIDVSEDDANVYVSADIPGLTEDELQVDFADRTLRIAGEKTTEKKDDGRRWVLAERGYGRFERHVPIARDIDHERVEARFDNGVLNVTLPKTVQGTGGRKIEVKRAS